MNLNTINTEDATTTESFGGVALKSGAYAIKILNCDKSTSRTNTTSLNFKIQIGDAIRYTTLWLTKVDTNTNAIVENEYDSRRLKQLLILLKIDPSTLTEVPTDNDWSVNIPQLKGSVGAVLEVSPANTKYNKKEFPKIDIVSFYIINTMQTLVEFTSKKQAETVMKEVEKLQKKEYIFTGSNQAPQGNSPQQFNVESDLQSGGLPF